MIAVRAFLVSATLSLASLASTAFAQSREPGGMPPPSGMSLARSAAMRFPQPVRVGDLLHRNVLQPVVTQILLGVVEQVVRAPDGTLSMVIRYGGVFGFGARLIAVPVDAMVLLGQEVEVVAFTPEQLNAFPAYAEGGATPLGPDDVIKVGLAKPSH